MTSLQPPLIGLLVGMHFHPPAQAVLEHIASGTSLEIRPEPDNPYDPHAMQVYSSMSHVPMSQRDELRLKLAGYGMTWEELELEPLLLGHLASEINKPFLKAQAKGEPITGGCVMFSSRGIRQAILEFGLTGAPLVRAIESPAELDTSDKWGDPQLDAPSGENTP